MAPMHSSKADELNYGKFDIGPALSFMSRRESCGDDSEARSSPARKTTMKPAPFDYIRPETLAEACEILASDDDARIIAGGQTLIPMLAMRLARPAKLIDILRLKELHGIRAEPDAVVIGAVTRQVEVERSEIIKSSLPLLARALPFVGHPPTRSRGTLGGSIGNYYAGGVETFAVQP